MKLLLTLTGYGLSRAGYVLGVIALIYGILTAIAGTFDWRIFVGTLLSTCLMYAIGQCLLEGKVPWKHTIKQVHLK